MQSSDYFPWFALRVRTGGEALIDVALQRREVQTLLPTFTECLQYSDRIKKRQRALFPGYLFCRFNPDLRTPILSVPGVQSIVSFNGTPTAVDPREIEGIRKVVAGGVAIPWPFLQTGQKVRIEYGAFAGLEGLLVQAKGSERLVLSVSLLQRSISVEIDRSWIKPL